MNRTILYITIGFTLGLSACASNEQVPSTYLSFTRYNELTKKCDTQEILDSFAAIDNPDLPKIPLQTVRLCQPDLLVLEFQSMWATQEFKIIDSKNRKFFTLETQSAGSRCTKDDGCDVLTDEECNAQKDCKHFRLVLLSDEAGKEITKATIHALGALMMTDEDFVKTIQSQTAVNPYTSRHIFFHIEGKQYVTDGTYPNEDARVKQVE